MEWQVVEPSQIPILSRKTATWKAIILDMETNGVNPWLGDRPISLGIAPFEDDKHYYLPLQGLNTLDLRPLLEPLEQKPLIGHNIKFDLHMLRTLDWNGQQESFIDTIVMARLWAIEEHPQLGLEELAKRIFGYEYADPTVVRAIKAGKAQDLSPQDAGHKCCEDLWLTRRLYCWLKTQLSPELLRLFVRETELTRDLFDIEERGAYIDKDYVSVATEHLEKEISALLADIRSQTAQDFNPRSPPQVRSLMEKLGIKPTAYTPKGEPSWNRAAMMEVRNQHPVALLIAKHRALGYQRSGLVETSLEYLKAGQEALHFEFKNWGTVTGRLSGNSQQMPKGWLQFQAGSAGTELLTWASNDKAQERNFSVRRIIRPRPGHVLVVADYRQIEMYVLGYYMKDPTFDAWLASGNVHAAAAQEVFGDGEKYYELGKIYNFATVYGQGDRARALQLGCTEEQAKQYRFLYEQRMPGHRRLLRRVERLLDREDTIANIYGRRYMLAPELAYVGVNRIVQGSSADYVKYKLPETRKLRAQIGIHIINTTHDDFVAEVPETEIHHIGEWLAELRKSPFGCDLELDVEYSETSLVDLQPLEEMVHVT